MDLAPHPMHEGVTSTVEPVTDADERDLLSRIAMRDREAMRDFYFLYHRRLTRFLARITPRRELLEDIVNEAFLIVWQRAAEYRGDSRVATWVMGIAWSHGLTSIRRDRRLTADPVLSSALEAERTEGRESLDRALTTLSPEHRALIDLAYVGGYSCDEIALIMRCPVRAVKTRLAHARQSLRSELEVSAALGACLGGAAGLCADPLHACAN